MKGWLCDDIVDEFNDAGGDDIVDVLNDADGDDIVDVLNGPDQVKLESRESEISSLDTTQPGAAVVRFDHM